jgi:hypothetical protein
VQPLARGVAQSVVWEEVAAKAGRHGVHSPTGAAADIYRSHDDTLSEMRGAFPLVPGQSGAVLTLGDDQLCLDYLSRSAAFARLYPKLLDGYLLDALEHLDGKSTSRDRATHFIAAIATLPQRRSPSAGLGDDLRLAGASAVASGLVVDGELLQLSAFTSDGSGPRTRVGRPSRRR